MRQYIFSAILCLAWVAILAPPTRAQWVCTITDSNYIYPNTYNDYWYTALNCSGKGAEVAATVTGQLDSVFGYYLAMLISADGGQTWNVERAGLPAPSVNHIPVITKIDQIDDLHIVAFGDSGLLVRTTDGGMNWGEITSPTSQPIEDLSFSDSLSGMMVVADTVHGTYVTSDGGLDWSVAPFTRYFDGQCHDYGNGMYRVFTMDKGIIYTTRNNWTTIDSTGPVFRDSSARHHVFLGCSFGVGDTMFAYGYCNAPSNNYYPSISRSTDGGSDWTTVYTGDTNVLPNWVYALSDISRDTIVAGLRGNDWNTVLMSTDHGISWARDTLLLANKSYIAGVNYGIGYNSEGDILGAYVEPGGGGEFLLLGTEEHAEVNPDPSRSQEMELYPNPAENVIKLSGSTPGKTIDIIDALGRVLITAIPTNGMLTLDIAQLPSGIYFVGDGTTRVKFVKE